jgi:PAS domain S-box-containing protein
MAEKEHVKESEFTERTALLEAALRGQGELLTEARRAQALLESTFNAIRDAIVVTNATGRISQANNAVQHLFNRAPIDVIGDTCHSLLAEGKHCPHATLALHESVIECELLNRAQDRVLNLRVSRVNDPDSGAIAFVHAIRDITRERVIERHLMQAERMSLAGQMVSAVAHEVATPLSVVANIAEMLRLDCEPGTPADEELLKIVTQVRRVTEMMRGLLNFVRQTPAQFTKVDLAQLAQETLELMRYELRKAQIETTMATEPNIPPVWGDRNQLQQVLLNLLTNAMQAMKQGGRLTLQIRAAESQEQEAKAVALVVADTGPGIATGAVGRLFDFFFTTRGHEGGTGLGLAITRQIIEGHRGRITAENTGDGAQFIVTLPAALPEHQADVIPLAAPPIQTI